GQYAIRGGIIDVYSFANENPYRIELDGDEVDTLREFDSEGQLSIKYLTEINLVPDVQLLEDVNPTQNLLDYTGKNSMIWFSDLRQQKLEIKTQTEQTDDKKLVEELYDFSIFSKAIQEF